MAVTPNSAVTVQTPKRGMVQIVAADTSSLKTLVTAGANGSKVASVNLASDDTSDRLVQLYVTRSGTDYLLGTVNVPTLSGTNGTAATVNAMNASMMPGLPCDNDGQPYLLLESGDVLKVKTTTTVTAAKTVHATANYGDF